MISGSNELQEQKNKRLPMSGLRVLSKGLFVTVLENFRILAPSWYQTADIDNDCIFGFVKGNRKMFGQQTMSRYQSQSPLCLTIWQVSIFCF